MINKPETSWNKVLFADESKFDIFGSDGRIIVLRRNNEELHSKNLVRRVKHGVLVWGCISASGLDNFAIIDGIMNNFFLFKYFKRQFKNISPKFGCWKQLYFLS